MESIYHHTSFNVLKSIVTDTGLNFRASKYSNYINGEYELTMPKFTSQILLLFSKVLHILENLLLKNFTGLKVVS